MARLIELIDLFDFRTAKSAEPLILEILACTSIEELQALLVYISNTPYIRDSGTIEAIVKLIHDRIEELKLALDHKPKKKPKLLEPSTQSSEPDDYGPSLF